MEAHDRRESLHPLVDHGGRDEARLREGHRAVDQREGRGRGRAVLALRHEVVVSGVAFVLAVVGVVAPNAHVLLAARLAVVPDIQVGPLHLAHQIRSNAAETHGLLGVLRHAVADQVDPAERAVARGAIRRPDRAVLLGARTDVGVDAHVADGRGERRRIRRRKAACVAVRRAAALNVVAEVKPDGGAEEGDVTARSTAAVRPERLPFRRGALQLARGPGGVGCGDRGSEQQ